MAMTGTTIENLAATVHATGDVLAQVRDDGWNQASPCDEWTALEVARHLVGSLNAYATAFGRPVEGETVGLLDGFASASENLLEALRAPEALEQTVAIPMGAVPARMALGLATVEVLVHGWDIAQATGQQHDWPIEAADAALSFSRQALQSIPAERSPFAPPVAVEGATHPMIQLVALLGRSPREV
jgi:uncharacterized protein (TIGR03086 family)